MNEIGFLVCLPGLLLLASREPPTWGQILFVSALVWFLIAATLIACVK